jgi:mRNA-degrading endonuclease YafQ of YafQ-DinJ toxin-antitoxin module
MKYRYRATEKFWTSFYRLDSQQKESCRRAWLIFKENPFDSRLRSHKIHRLSASYGRTIYAASIEDDLRLLFYLEGETITSLIVGTHDIYKS